VDLIFIQAMTEVTIEGLPPAGIELDPEAIIVRPINAKVLSAARMLFHPFIGRIHLETIETAGAANFLDQIRDHPVDETFARRFVMRSMAWTQQFLFSLWLVKDNSGNAGDGHLLLAEVGRGPTGFYSQRPGVLNFTADCHRTPTSFSAGELEEALGYYHKLKGITPEGEYHIDAPRPSGLVFDSRVVRTIYFAQAARSSADIAVKMAFQCLCFESLFASSSDSITHRVSERAAILVGSDAVDQRRVYDDVKKLYATRSQVVHGNPIRHADLSALREVAKRADEHLRRSIRRIVASPELSELFAKKDWRPVDEYFLERILTGPPSTTPAASEPTPPPAAPESPAPRSDAPPHS